MEYLQNSAYYELIVFWRLLLAALLGGLIGVEREVHGRPAGFRTHLLVTLGACLMMVVSEYFVIKYAGLNSDSVLRIDPARVAAQIVTGIGFLGAGAIIKDGHGIRGLTTAACLWVSAGIGMAVGAGFYSAALLVTVIALFSLIFLKRFEFRLKKDRYRNLIVYCQRKEGIREYISDLLVERGMKVVDFSVETNIVAGEARYEFVVTECGDDLRVTFPDLLAEIEGVRKVRLH